MTRTAGFVLLLMLTLFPALAWGHPGHADADGLREGLLHPLVGLDHLLAAALIGWWAQARRRASADVATSALPGLFVGSMILGFGLSPYGLLDAVVVEWLIALTLIALAIQLLKPRALVGKHAFALVALAGLTHGLAHGSALGATAAPSSWLLGITLSTAVLHAAGLWIGQALTNRRWARPLAAGGTLAFASIMALSLAFSS